MKLYIASISRLGRFGIRLKLFECFFVAAKMCGAGFDELCDVVTIN